MSVDSWIAMEGHPRQRDTARQARKSHWLEGRQAIGAISESHRWVVAAEYEGKLYKVDGHTRAHLWGIAGKAGLRRPPSVFVTVHRCKTFSELVELYGVFDNLSAAEKQIDRVSGGMRQLGIKLESKRLKYGMLTDALSIAWRGVARGPDSEGHPYEDFDVFDALSAFRAELLELDKVNAQPDVFHSGVIAAALLSLALDPASNAFFMGLSKSSLAIDARPPFDPMAGIRWRMLNIREDQASRAPTTQESVCGQVLLAVQIFSNGRSDPRYYSDAHFDDAPDIVPIVKRVRELKQSTRSA
jgi:hypothetical protein